MEEGLKGNALLEAGLSIQTSMMHLNTTEAMYILCPSRILVVICSTKCKVHY